MKKDVTLIIVIIVLMVVALFGGILLSPQSFKRKLKTFTSEYKGGMERTLEVYSNTGELIKVYEGKFDIQTDDAGKLLFDINNKRHIIHGGIVIVEEK